MPVIFFPIHFILIVLLLSGCTSNTQSQLTAKGQQKLSAEELFTIVADNSLHLEAVNFNATVYFQKNGLLSAEDRLKNMDTGKWDISSDNELCLKFRIWYYGDSKCYSVFRGQKTDSFIFFTTNGARYYSAEYRAADPYNLAGQLHKTEKKQFLRKQLAEKGSGGTNTAALKTPSPPAAPVTLPVPPPITEKAPDIVHLARNCPDCNLAGANLRDAHLVGANLAGANLSGADLSGANLRRADLTGANLAGAKCIAANLAGAILIKSNLSGSDFTNSNLIKAKLNDASLDGAIFTGAHLEGIEGYKQLQ